MEVHCWQKVRNRGLRLGSPRAAGLLAPLPRAVLVVHRAEENIQTLSVEHLLRSRPAAFGCRADN